ncbi:MAG TPA: tetratricopeptide repeat protein [Candidatus Acidoferrales bacterium]|nr:tetratricopeptide repeat protein [Candidatus Acidoferrales bacterium]
MNAKLVRPLLAALALALCALPARPQSTLVRAEGHLSSAGKPLVDAQVVLIQQGMGKTYKAKTDKDGAFSISGIARGRYTLEIFSVTGYILYRKSQQFDDESGTSVRFEIELSGAPGMPSPASSAPAPASAPEKSQPSPAENAQDSSVKALISQYNSALAAKDWPAAITALKAIVAADPTRWDYFESLGEAQINVGDYENAAESFDKGVQGAHQALSGTLPGQPKLFSADRERIRSAISQMLLSEGNAYLKIKRNNEAIAAYTKSAELSADPATAYFNLCIAHFNTRTIDGAAEACDKAAAASPYRAETYFAKGSLLFTAAKTNKDGSISVPPGTVEALKKYLELAPQGSYANNVRQMLQYIGAKGESSGKGGKTP